MDTGPNLPSPQDFFIFKMTAGHFQVLFKLSEACCQIGKDKFQNKGEESYWQKQFMCKWGFWMNGGYEQGAAYVRPLSAYKEGSGFWVPTPALIDQVTGNTDIAS